MAARQNNQLLDASVTEDLIDKESDRSALGFAAKARETFFFLGKLGFTEIDSLPTLLRFKKGSIDVDVYHGRQSYEIGVGVGLSGDRYELPGYHTFEYSAANPRQYSGGGKSSDHIKFD
jgi:hypothetical protein